MADKMIEDISAFKTCMTQTTGGVTGSFQVRGIANHKLYQFKPSILDNTWPRKFKAGGYDRENFGEFIAASIAQALIKNGAPNVSLVYDKQKKRVSIVSQYLESQQKDGVRNLDDYARENGLNIPDKKHVQFIKGKASNSDKQDGKLGLDDVPSINKKNFAETLALSAILGDHDINPGNMMVVAEQYKTRIVRIDFGHAFNDLLNALKCLHGQLIDKKNPIMDYFNREKIAGINNTTRQSKVWRDYPGMILTKELASALCDLGERAAHVEEAIQQSKAAFLALIDAMVKNQDMNGCEHVIKSLIAIVNNVNGTTFKRINSNIPDNIPPLFEQLKQFIINNCANAKYVGEVMGLQVAIDEQLKTPGTMDTILHSVSSNFSLNTVLKNHQPIQWVKTDKNTPPFFGSLQEYVINRKINYLEQQVLKRSPEKLIQSIHATIKQYDAGKKLSADPSNKNTFVLKQKAMHDYLNRAILCLDNDDLVGAKTRVNELSSYLEKNFGKKKFLGKDSTAYMLVEKIKDKLNNPPNDDVKEMDDYLALFGVEPKTTESHPKISTERALTEEEKDDNAFLAVLNADIENTPTPMMEQMKPKSNTSPHSTVSITRSFKTTITNNKADETRPKSTHKPQSGA